jgi:hypothetical protein
VNIKVRKGERDVKRMSKHVICKSKTLDVPIIITSTIQGVGGGGGGGGGSLGESANSPTSPPILSSSNHSSHPIYIENNSPIVAAAVKYKLDKGYSLDSKYLLHNNHQSSLSSSSTNNDMTSSTNSISSSTSNNKHFLSPPPSIDLIPTSIFNAAAAANFSSLAEDK